MKYLGINLTKYIEELHEENYKTLVKEVKGLNVERCTMFVNRRLTIAKMLILPNLIYRFIMLP